MTRCTVSGKTPVNPDDAPVPNSATKPDGQHVDHWVLCETERAKGFVRPVRESYIHVGRPGPKYYITDITDPELLKNFADMGWTMYEPYPPGAHGSALGRYWSQKDFDSINKGCGCKTTMPYACAETYARSPGYYGTTFCCGCGTYLKVGRDGEFVWDGTDERVGT